MNIFSLQEKILYSQQNEEKYLRKIAKLLCLILTTRDEVEKYAQMMQSHSSDYCVRHYNIDILNLFDPELQLINTKSKIKCKLQELLSELKKFKTVKSPIQMLN